MPEDIHSHIDREQTRIDALDSLEDNKILSGEKNYTDTFLHAVDQFQDFVRSQSESLSDEIKHQQLHDIRNFLITVTASNDLETLAQGLNAKLTEFRSTIILLDEELQKRIKTAPGDTIGKIVTRKLGISVEQNPQKFFQAVHFLQEKRENPGSILSFENGKAVWKQGNADPNKLAIGEYILTDGLENVDGKASDPIQWYLDFPSSAPYKNFVESINTAPGATGGDIPRPQEVAARSNQPPQPVQEHPQDVSQQEGSSEGKEASEQAVDAPNEEARSPSLPAAEVKETAPPQKPDASPNPTSIDTDSILRDGETPSVPSDSVQPKSEPEVQINHDSISPPPVDEGTRRLGLPSQPDSELTQAREIWESLDESDQMDILLAGAQKLQEGVELSDPQKRRIEQVKLLMTAVQAMKQKIEEVKDWQSVFLSEGNMLHKLGVYMADEGDRKALLAASEKFLTQDALTLPQSIIQNPAQNLDQLIQQNGNGPLISIMQKGGLDFPECNTEADLAAQKVKLIQYLRAIDDYQTARLTCEDELKSEFDAVLTGQFSQRIRSQTVQIGNETQQEKVIGDIYDRVVEEVRKKSETSRSQAITELVDNNVAHPQQAYESHLQSMIYMTYQHEKNKTIADAVYQNGTYSIWSPEKQAYWKEYKDSMGIGRADVSDESMDTIINEFMINAPMIILSGGLASGARAVGTKVLSRGAQAFMRREVAQNLALMAARSGYVADKALKLSKVARGIGAAGGLLTEGAVFEITNAGLHGEWLGNSPEWAQRILWSSATLGAFHQAGKIGGKLVGVERKIGQEVIFEKGLLTPLTEKISNTAVRKGIEELLIKGHVEVATMLLMGAIQNGVADRSALSALKALVNPEDIFHAYISAGALKISGKGIETLSGKVLAAREKKQSIESGDKPINPKVADIESTVSIRAEHMKRISEIDSKTAKDTVLKRELPRIEHELSNIERNLNEHPDLPEGTRKSLERQKTFLEEKQTEFEAVLELRREDRGRESREKIAERQAEWVASFEKTFQSIHENLRNFETMIQNVTSTTLNALQEIASSIVSQIRFLESKITTLSDKSYIDRFITQIRELKIQYKKLLENLRQKNIALKSNINEFEIGEEVKIIGPDNKIISARILARNPDGSLQVEYEIFDKKETRSVGNEELSIANEKTWIQQTIGRGQTKRFEKSDSRLQDDIIIELSKSCKLYIVSAKKLGLKIDGYIVSTSRNPKIQGGSVQSPHIILKPNEKVTLGKESMQNIFPSLTSQGISRKHVEIGLSSNGELSISDLNSRNGTSYKAYDYKEFAENLREADYQTLDKLWPQGLSNAIQQGATGDCYFLAALESVKRSPIGRRILAETVHELPNGSWSVRFKGDSRNIIISLKDVKEMKQAGKLMREGALGDQILERAYARLIKEIQGNIRIGNRGGDTIIAPNGEGVEMAFEGGYQTEVFTHLLGKEVTTSMIILTTNPNLLSQSNANQLLGAATFTVEALMRRSDFDKLFDAYNKRLAEERLAHPGDKTFQHGIKYLVTDINGRQRPISCEHAYSIAEINRAEKYVEVVNPHDTHGDRIKLSFDEFNNKFSYLSVGTLISP